MTRRARLYTALAISAIAVFCLLALVSPSYGLVRIRVNKSASLPQTLFLGRPVKGPLRHDAIISFEHSIHDGPLAKQVIGLSGDPIEIRDNHIFVAGEDRGEVQSSSPSGKPLTPLSISEVPDGHLFVWGPHRLSFDSRYEEFGLVPESEVKEVLWAVF